MILWLDAQFSPALAPWLTDHFGLEARALRDIGLRDADDREIFEAGRIAGCVVVTKDKDFVDLIDRLGPPPQIIWVTCGNTSNSRMRELFLALLPEAMKHLNTGEALIEIGDLLNE